MPAGGTTSCPTGAAPTAALASSSAARIPASHAPARDGAPIVVYDGRGGQYPATLRCEGATARARLGSFDPLERESPLKLTLIQALVAAEKIDWIVEKAVELGVERIVIVPMQRSVVRLVAPRAARRLHHWTDIARAASSQCGRNRVPSVDLLGDLGGALAAVPAEHDRMLLVLDPDNLMLMAAVQFGHNYNHASRAAMYAWVARSHKIDYLLPAHAGDDLIVYTWVADMLRASSLRRYEITRVQDQAILARAETRWAFVNLASRKPIRIPPEVQGDFELVPNGLASP